MQAKNLIKNSNVYNVIRTYQHHYQKILLIILLMQAHSDTMLISNDITYKFLSRAAVNSSSLLVSDNFNI